MARRVATIRYLGLAALLSGPATGFKTAYREAIAAGLMRAAETWQKVYLPRHFKEGARAKYNMPKLTQEYIRKKIKKYGHKKPLVWSGESERQITSELLIPRVRRGAGRMPLSVEVGVHAPSDFSRYKRKSGESNKDLLGRTTAKERQEMAVAVHRTIVAAIGDAKMKASVKGARRRAKARMGTVYRRRAMQRLVDLGAM